MPLGIDPTVDYAFKKLFAVPANTDLLIHLLNAVLAPPTIVAVELLNPFNEKEFADDKLSVLDIKARDSSGVWYNVEVQSRVHWSLPARLAYYSAHLYVDQLPSGEDYDSLMPAITICFLKENIFRGMDAPHLRFVLCDSRHQVELTDRLQVHTIELAKYNFQGVALAAADRLDQWAYFLNHAADLEAVELKRILPQPEFVKATGVIEMIAQTPQERREYEARRKAELDHRSFLNDARREGRAEGREEGREEARRILANQVVRLQRLLREPVFTSEYLLKLDFDALVRLNEELSDRLDARSP